MVQPTSITRAATRGAARRRHRRAWSVAVSFVALVASIAMAARADAAPPRPAAPSDLTATAVSAREIDLRWRDNSTNELGFAVYRSVAGRGGPFREWVRTNPDQTSFADYQLEALTEYCYEIKALGRNATADSAFSNIACATTLSLAPAAPTGVRATPWTSTSIHVTWNPSSTDDTFRVERSPTGTAPWQLLATNPSWLTEAWDQAAPTEQRMCYRVFAVNVYGDSAPSVVACASAPAAPGNLTGVAADAYTIDLAWVDNSSVEDGHEITRWVCDNGTPTIVGHAAANATSYRDQASTSDTRYCYRVRATNSGGSGDPSNYVFVILMSAPLAAPSAAGAAPLGTGTQVSWTDNSGSEEGFRIERSHDSGATWTLAGSTGPDGNPHGGPIFWDVDQPLETELCYRVTAFNALGESAPSNVGCTMIPIGPSDLTGTFTDVGLELRWIDHSSVEDGFQVFDYCSAEMGWMPLVSVPADTTNALIQELPAWWPCTYVVAAKRDGGTSLWSNEVTP